MRRRHKELITALAEGRLEDETEARALIESSPKLRQEYEAQHMVREAMGAVPEASLSETERASLHRDVWTGLTTTSRPTARRTPGAWAYVAAGGLLVVGVVSVLAQMDRGVDTAREMQSTVESAEDGSGEAADTTTVGVTGAPAEPTAAALDFADTADEARAGTTALFAAESTITEECLEQAGVADLDVLGEIEEAGSRYAILVPDAEDVEAGSPVTFVDLATCEIAHRDG